MREMSLLSFYIVDCKSGISYDPTIDMGKVLIASSSGATDTKDVVINVAKITRGLAERRYRLIPKGGL